MKFATVMLFVIGAGFWVLPVSGRALSQTPSPTCEPLPPGQIVVRIVSGGDVYALANAHGDTVLGKIFEGSTDEVLSRFWLIKVPEGAEYDKVLEYSADPNVQSADPICNLFDEPAYPPTPSPSATPADLPRTGGPPTP